MSSVFLIFGRPISLYGLLLWCGVLVAAAIGMLICPKKSIRRYDIPYSAVYTMVGAMLGAKLLFLLISWKQLLSSELGLLSALFGGFVFYGGLIGGALGLWIYCKQFKLRFGDFAQVYATVLPLGHALGRVGCFFAGCCYGIAYDGPLSHTYHTTLGSTPVGVPLFPVQLAEALGLLILFVILITVYFQINAQAPVIPILYAMLYALLRFCLEFLRGDRERGILLGISTSQWICLLLFFAALAESIRRLYKRKQA
ncbi:MAG: prolipoprotein diacylglyceryl transferase [Clostridia bacterium]|nr:prolipoprotein diacylglyceryl transferase [Clostridia bacterium]